MLVTVILSLVLMAGLFLMLWSAVAFIQDKRFFTSAPKDVLAAVRPRTAERFPGARRLGWRLMILAIALMIVDHVGAVFFTGRCSAIPTCSPAITRR